MTMRRRIIVLICSLIAMSALIGGVSLYSLNETVGGLRTVYLDRVVPLEGLKGISDAYAVSIVDASHKASNENISYSQAAQEVKRARALIDKNWQDYLATYLVPQEQRLVDQIKPLMNAATPELDRLEVILKENNQAELKAFIKNKLYPTIDPLSETISNLTNVQLVVAKQEYNDGVNRYKAKVLFVVFIMLGCLVIGAFQSTLLLKYLNKNLGAEPSELKEAAVKIAQGNLRPVQYARAPRGVLSEIEVMRSNLHTLVSDVISGSEQIESATLQLATSADQVTAGAAQQSGVAASMAAAMEELSVSISHIADNAKTAEGVAHTVRENGLTAFSMVQSLIAEIQSINDHVIKSSENIDHLASQSHRINSIVEVIRGIAEQTNLLALNAAIEAARAGEQGRGFAVVADEVRNLAARTSQSTSEIVSLVEAINNGIEQAKVSMVNGCSRIDQGMELVHKTGATMSTINNAVIGNLNAVSAIAMALNEQRAAGDDVARNVEIVAQIVEENTAAQSGISQAAQALKQLGDQMHALTQKFSV